MQRQFPVTSPPLFPKTRGFLRPRPGVHLFFPCNIRRAVGRLTSRLPGPTVANQSQGVILAQPAERSRRYNRGGL